MPCGQKKSSTEMIQSHTVTPPFAAIDGTTFRLKTATTNSSIRSQRPRTRFRCGGFESEDKGRLVGRADRLGMGVSHDWKSNSVVDPMVIPTERNYQLARYCAHGKTPVVRPAAWRDKQTAGPTFSWFGTTKS